LTVQSRLGEGTAVTVKLPLVYAPPQTKASDRTAAESKIATLTPVLRQELQDQPQDQPALVKKSA
jgi:two-component system, cell cycle sensor histidine kinase DivJ